jgi:serine protease Do
LSDTRGAIVARISPKSPAEAAGLSQNDVIVAFDGIAVDDYHHLQRLSSDADVGKTVKVDFVRKKTRQTVDLKVAEAPDAVPAAPSTR